MRSTGVLSAWLFRITVAIAAAAVADPIVEHLSNTGVFGPGRFTDRSNLDVIPALTIASGVAILFVAILARRMLARNSYPPEWLRRYAFDITADSVRRMLPTIFALQLVALFVMETIEQIVVAGHPFGGTLWLGGPLLVSIAAHFLSCVLSAWALYHGLRWSARAIVRAVRLVLQFLRQLIQAPLLRSRAYGLAPRSKFIEPYLRALQGRAPPQSCRV